MCASPKFGKANLAPAAPSAGLGRDADQGGGSGPGPVNPASLSARYQALD